MTDFVSFCVDWNVDSEGDLGNSLTTKKRATCMFGELVLLAKYWAVVRVKAAWNVKRNADCKDRSIGVIRCADYRLSWLSLHIDDTYLNQIKRNAVKDHQFRTGVWFEDAFLPWYQLA